MQISESIVIKRKSNSMMIMIMINNENDGDDDNDHDSDDDNVHPRKIGRKYVSLTDKLAT